MMEHDIAIIGFGMVLLYADIAQHYIINDTVKGYFGSWKSYMRKLICWK